MEKLIAALQPRPAPTPMGRNATPTATATTAMIHVARRTWVSSGLGCAEPRCDSAAMRPSSVCMPVRVTTVVASPPVQVVPLKTRSWASSSEPAISVDSALRSAGTDSPVNADRSTVIAPSMMRASALTRSPSAMIRTSPGTSSRAGISVRAPSRITRTVAGRNAARASTACSACISWTNAKPALSRITATTATASAGVPPAQASPAATASRMARGWVNCDSNSPGQRRPVRRTSSLGPCTTVRRAASRPASPCGEVRRSRSSTATGSRAFTSISARSGLMVRPGTVVDAVMVEASSPAVADNAGVL
ncbi:hypothetical protein B0I29_11917 [Actinoplanes lutulentus]|uniref:Uncharacterized protein n=1 Tax=Actinoplanes lutulentus TaxID=1287878 RepID=A0A327Z1P7_9ACTN|nr:hypothetical protein B0I29_11917 [Actinoplanes lutulentus]